MAHLKRLIIGLHRWLGILACLALLCWFPSGIAMMYWPYPSVRADDYVGRLPGLDPATVRMSPREAYATLDRTEPPSQVRLTSFNGRPMYQFDGDIVFADVGGTLGEPDRQMIDGIAEAWVKQPVSAATVEAVEDIDQWTLLTGVEPLKPLWKYSWPNGEQAYVSEATLTVVQYTTTASRIGAYLGPITHWLYFTPIRRHASEWTRFMTWASGISVVAAVLGVIVGIWMSSPRRRYRHDGKPSMMPYRGIRRWHLAIGMVFGLAAITWTFSGFLTLDPLPRRWTSTSDVIAKDPADAIFTALSADLEFAAFAAKHPRTALTQLAGLSVKELELTTFDGESLYLATLAGGATRLVPVTGPPRVEFDRRRLAEIATAAVESASIDVEVIDTYDAYYIDRRGRLPLPVIRARVGNDLESRVYIDPRSATVVGKYHPREWFTRWIYRGLHSFDFPWLVNHRPAWDIVVITFMLGGTMLAGTSLLLAWRVVGRALAALFRHAAGLGATGQSLGRRVASTQLD